MAQIKLVAFYGKSFVSKSIRYFTRSKKYSHIAVMMPDGRLIEAWPHGKSKIKSWTDWSDWSAHTPGTKYEIWSLEVSDNTASYCHNRWIEMAEQKVPYDWWGIVGFVFKKIKNSKAKLFCSEMWITPSVEVKQFQSINPENIDPASLVAIIEYAGGKLEKTDIV